MLAQCWQPFSPPFFVRSQENQPKQKGQCKIWGSHNAADEGSGLLVCYALSLLVVPKISKESGAFSNESRRLFVRNFKNHSPVTLHHIPRIPLTTHQRETLLFLDRLSCDVDKRHSMPSHIKVVNSCYVISLHSSNDDWYSLRKRQCCKHNCNGRSYE